MLAILVMVSFNLGISQSVGINQTGAPPDSSAMLDISSTTKGLLVPTMTTPQMNLIASPKKGLLIYNTSFNQFFHNAGTAFSPNWKPITAGAWGVSGNTGTNPFDNFIGTTDNVPLIFRTNDIFSGGIDPIRFNSFFGCHAGEDITTGLHNVAVGASALQFNTAGSEQVAVGDSALHDFVGTNGRNLAIGYRAGRNIWTGTNNNYLGHSAGYSNQFGNGNTAIGAFSLYSNAGGSNNMAIGNSSLYSCQVYGRNIAIGDSSMYSHTTGMQNTVIGYRAMFSGINNFYNTYLGYEAGLNASGGNYNVVIGYQPLKTNDGGDENVAIGRHSLKDNTTGSNNTSIGTQAMEFATTGHDNVAIGNHAGWQIGVGDYNIAIGSDALKLSGPTNRNVAIGDSTLSSLEAGGGENTVIGSQAGASTTNGNNNCFFGHRSAYMNITGDGNVAIGNKALFETTNADGNITIGRFAGDAFDLGDDNTMIGGYTDVDASGYTASTALGYNALITASNQVRLGNATTGSIGGYQNWTNISDGRFKKNIQENVHGLDFILQLRPVTYTLDIRKLEALSRNEIPTEEALLEKRETEIQSGFIAQEVEAAAGAVGYVFSGVDAPKNELDTYGLRYAEFVVPIVKAMQEQQAQIELLREQNEALLARLEVLEKRD